MWLGEPAGAVDHQFDWTACGPQASRFHREIRAQVASIFTKTNRQPVAKLGARFPSMRTVAKDRHREITVRPEAERDGAVDAVLRVDVVAECARVLQCHGLNFTTVVSNFIASTLS